MSNNLPFWQGIAVICTGIIASATIIYKALIFFYCEGKNKQIQNDHLKDLSVRISNTESDLLRLQIEYDEERKNSMKKWEEIKETQSKMFTDIAIIKTILKKNFPGDYD